MRRLVAILNPQADRGRTAQLAASLEEALAGRFEVRLLQTTRQGEAVELARGAAERGCDAVIAIGGDGTVHEVANGLMALPAEARPAMGIIPAGSGNDVAYALGITKDLWRSVEMIERGKTRAIDVGHVRSASGRSCYSINNIGTLLEGQINLASHRLTWPRGSALYMRAMLQTLVQRPAVARLELRLDGVDSVREAVIFSIGNGPRSGGKFLLVPGASVDDGRFDYIVAPPTSRLRLLWKVRHAIRGRGLDDAWIERGQFASLTVRSSIPLITHVDGESWLRPEENVRELSVEVLARCLRILCKGAVAEHA